MLKAVVEPGSLPHVVAFVAVLAAVAVVIAVIRWLLKSGRRAAAGIVTFMVVSGSVPTWLEAVEPWLQSNGWWPQ